MQTISAAHAEALARNHATDVENLDDCLALLIPTVRDGVLQHPHVEYLLMDAHGRISVRDLRDALGY